MAEKILLVDDEPNVLQAAERLLRNRFETDTAIGSAQGLSAIENKGPYAVVLSDLKMPQMDGIQFLTKVRNLSPDTVRIILTGHADVETAINAVNDGNIFRFLTKPCSQQTLTNALTAGLAQYRLVTSEKNLLEKTLAGSLTVLTEVLSMASPAAFSRAMRLKRYMSHIVTKLGLANGWKFELAAMLSQLGCVTMAPETVEAVYKGHQLPPNEQALYETHPQIARDLLKNIPRLESVAWMIAHQNQPTSVDGDVNDRELEEKRVGAQLLSAILAFDARARAGSSRTEAAFRVSRQHQDLDPRVMPALVEVEPEDHEKQVCTCRIEEISPGMIIEADVSSQAGQLIIARNQEVTPSVILKLKNYRQKGLIADDIAVSTPQSPAPAKN
jgi:response regulator RpfG family c-di-GMP phosphodiesterase